jgi:uncharacterized repeat protein (TIGR02543 family)
MTLYAKWTVDISGIFTVIFDSNGGSAVLSQIVNKDEKVSEPQDVTKAGYNTLDGWYTESTFITQWDFAVNTVIKNLTLYAKWTDPISYTVQYDKNSNEVDGTMEDSNHIYGVGQALSANGYTRTNYTFAGWNTEANGDGTNYTNGQNVENLATTEGEVFTLYAQWNLLSYTVRYDKNATDATGTMEDSTHSYGIGQALSANGYTRTGYTFTGWNTATNGGGTNYTDGQNVENLAVTEGAIFTLYAQWTIHTYTVTFDSNGGSTVDSLSDVPYGSTINKPADPAKDGLSFGGWYRESNFNTAWNFTTNTVTDNIILYAAWLTLDNADFGPGAVISNTFNVSNYTEWDDAVYVIRNSGNSKNYIINVTDSFDIPGYTSNTFGSASSIKVSIRGEGKTISLSFTGNILRIGVNQTVILRDVSLQGRSNNTTGLVYLNGTGTYAEAIFTMNSGKISGNSSSNNGAGVYINNGTFTMNGGEISGNSSSGSTANSGGGGVYVNSGTFVMNGGEISSNTSSSGIAAYSGGGGVYVASGTFTMNDGEISGNTSFGSGGNNNNTGGGGVFIYNGIFIMYAGKISGNTTSGGYYGNGGGVNVDRGTFTMYGGEISDNTARGSSNGSGGGVYLRSIGVIYGTFAMYGGKITSNTAINGSGGGVSGGGIFTMNGGEISDNTATNNGGGVSVSSILDGGVSPSNFTMNGGKITGNNATRGGGVYGSLTMNGGEIYANTASNYGGGVVSISFRISTGTIYGSDEGINSNTATEGAAFYRGSNGIAQYGTFNGSTWNSNGLLFTTNDTIRVVEGVLQQ